jgi:FtsP/CotA-like multicopper oxidase with cupredoxin domain
VKPVERREFLKQVGLGVAGATAWAHGARAKGRAFSPDVELELRAAPAAVALAPGTPTRVWSYTGRVLHGHPTTLQGIPRSFVGPVMRLQQGQRVRVHLVNDLPEPTIIHWHGLDVPERADGHPRLAVGSGQKYVYEFEVINRAGTYWYHPHPHMRTASQVMRGLAGVILVSDPTEASLKLPSGSDEIVCVLQDRQLDADNQIVHTAGMPMDLMTGFLGNRVLVNGRLPETLSLATRAYRIRFMNGSNSRVYKLAWDDDSPIIVIGTDGGLLERPVTRRFVTLAPGERADTILDLSTREPGTRLLLRSLAFPQRPFDMPMGGGRGRGRGMGRARSMKMDGDRGLPNGAPIDILPISIDRRERAGFALPERLSTYDRTWQPPLSVPTRVVRIDFRMMRFFLNGRQFDMTDVAEEETVTAGSTHVWEFDNSGPAMMNMRIGHPMHLHGRQFRVLKRQIEPGRESDWQALKDGFVDEGWKDTVLVMPGERVQVLVQFSRYPGLFLYHCHNLEHEDMGMMRNYRIV